MNNPSDPSNPAESPDFELIGCFPDMAQAFDRALVILAMRLGCEIGKNPDGDGYVLLADPGEARRIHEELAVYEQEQAVPVPVVVELKEYNAGFLPAVLWVVVLGAVFWWQHLEPWIVDRGVSSPRGIFGEGEWWRAFSALFLHADLMHLFGNLLSGVLLAHWVCRAVGPWLGWGLILLAGTLGNALNAASRMDEPFSSLGASTAVFGALGILTGFAVFHAARSHFGVQGFRRLVPLAGGLVLLSWLGVGSDPRTDVAAHLCGFGVGFVLGLASGWWRGRR